MNNLLSLINSDIVISANKYIYNGKYVPRVTEILSSMLHEDVLMGWSNSLGFKRLSYKKTLADSANVGTFTHSAIENYLNTNTINLDDVPPQYKYNVENALYSFIEWFKVILKNDLSILGLETELVCEWFGGTYDMLVRINNKTYLVDFKTSNRITYKHFIQASAYRYMLSLNNVNIDGVIILQLSKSDIGFNEFILHFDNTEHYQFIENCFNTFKGLVYGYYYRMHTVDLYNNIF